MDKMDKAEKDIRLDVRYHRNPQYLFRNVAGEAVLVPVGEAALKFNGMASLNETGAFLWNLLEKDHTAKELADALAQHYEVSAEEGMEDSMAFLKLALNHDLIREEEIQ